MHIFDYRGSSRGVQETYWFGDSFPTIWTYLYDYEGQKEVTIKYLVDGEPASNTLTVGDGPDPRVTLPTLSSLLLEQSYEDNVKLTITGDIPAIPDINSFVQSSYSAQNYSAAFSLMKADKDAYMDAMEQWATEISEVTPTNFRYEFDGLDLKIAYGGNDNLLSFQDGNFYGYYGSIGVRTSGNDGSASDRLFDHSNVLMKVFGTRFDDAFRMPDGSDVNFKLLGGNDTVVAKYWDDDAGDTFSTVLNGGNGTDTIELLGGLEDWKLNVAGSPGDLTVKMTHDISGRIIKMKDFEFLKFGDEAIPIVEWKFVVKRGQDGIVKRIEFWEDGDLKKSSNASKYQAYDDATPVKAGTYDAVYRTNSSKPAPVIEFAKNDGTSDVPGRTHIEIHNGNFTYNSEGCIVASPKRFLNDVKAMMEEKLEDMSVNGEGAGIKFYDLPIPIQVEVMDVDGKVNQPKLGFKKDEHKVQEATKIVKVPLKFKNDGDVDGITKRIDVKFKLLGSSTNEKGDVKVDHSNLVKSLGNDTFKFTISHKNKNDVVKIPIKIFEDKDNRDELLKFEIKELTLYNVKPDGSAKKYVDYNVASDLLLDARNDTLDLVIVDV
ncbi:hypothetical protein [Tropicimonas sediminicola]|uniref:Uncharacterized protein n=1 Tax=Tropicimonas sediminicola TaxID=1031541 RepID=A0A239M3G1_9RHOB|nr:hypothetical protein [Tropicimonas sediminicola]SNT36688.1 hypothetical protein SAMN05421757_11233 [Tropicimonas sediminicola]